MKTDKHFKVHCRNCKTEGLLTAPTEIVNQRNEAAKKKDGKKALVITHKDLAKEVVRTQGCINCGNRKMALGGEYVADTEKKADAEAEKKADAEAEKKSRR